MAPTLNSVTSGDKRVTVAFTAGANNGASITDYEYSLNSGAYISAGTTTSPFTISGLLLSPFMSSAPHCIALRWLIIEGSNVILTMWIVFGTYAIRCMLRR